MITADRGGQYVVPPPVVKMFKFNFVQDGRNEQAQTVQNEKNDPNKSVLTEISLIELVRATPRLELTGNLWH
jgi:hypothetical protein